MKKVAFLLVLTLFCTTHVSAQATISVNKDKDGKEYVSGIPEKFTLEYFAKVKRGTNPLYYVVLAPKDYDDANYYSDFQVYTGHLGKRFRSCRLLQPVTRYRDGGTTDIETISCGTLHFPSPAEPEEKALLIQERKDVKIELVLLN
jgi:hypothetical protein